MLRVFFCKNRWKFFEKNRRPIIINNYIFYFQNLIFFLFFSWIIFEKSRPLYNNYIKLKKHQIHIRKNNRIKYSNNILYILKQQELGAIS